MKYLKTYENFDEQDLGRFNQEDMIEPENNIQSFDDDEYPEFPEDMEDTEDIEDDEFYNNDFEEDEENRIENRRMWGDERMVESRKRFPKKDDKCGSNCKCKDKKDDKCGPNCKCEEKGKEKPKGLTAAQKKLPKALQDSILKRQK